MRRTFSDAQLVELGLITGAFIVLGRLHRAFGVAPMGPRSHAVLAGTLPPPDTRITRAEPGAHGAADVSTPGAGS